jgi:hypothetical protein
MKVSAQETNIINWHKVIDKSYSPKGTVPVFQLHQVSLRLSELSARYCQNNDSNVPSVLVNSSNESKSEVVTQSGGAEATLELFPSEDISNWHKGRKYSCKIVFFAIFFQADWTPLTLSDNGVCSSEGTARASTAHSIHKPAFAQRDPQTSYFKILSGKSPNHLK